MKICILKQKRKNSKKNTFKFLSICILEEKLH